MLTEAAIPLLGCPIIASISATVRACHNCGYLVPDSWDTCKRCHAALKERVAAGAGMRRATPYSDPGTRPAPVAAPVGLAPKPPPPPLPTQDRGSSAAAFDAGYSAPARLGVPDPDTNTFAPPPSSADPNGAHWSPPAPPARTSHTTLAVRVLAAIVVVLIALGGWQFLQSKRHAPPAEVAAYNRGRGPRYAPLGQGFTARLPAIPTETTQTATVNGATVAMHIAIVRSDQWEAGIVTIDLPAPLPAQGQDAAMRDAFAQGSDSVSGRVDGQKTTTHEGWPAMDAEITPPDGHPLLARIIVVNSRAYMLMAHSVDGTRGFFDTLVDSFHVMA
jgi:hypothetical protein